MSKTHATKSESPNQSAKNGRNLRQPKKTAAKGEGLHCRQPTASFRLARALYAAGMEPMRALRIEREIAELALAAAGAQIDLLGALRKAGAL